MRERRAAYRDLMRKPEGKRPLGKPMRRLRDNIKMNLQGVCRVRWIGSLWFRIEIDGGQL